MFAQAHFELPELHHSLSEKFQQFLKAEMLHFKADVVSLQ